MDGSPPGSSVHGIAQARILEWVATSFSRGSSQPRDSASLSWIGGQILYHSNTCGCCCSVTQSCLSLCDPIDCSLPGSSVHEIFQARVLEWAAISFSRGSSQPRDGTWVSHIAGRHFTVWATREAPLQLKGLSKSSPTPQFKSINSLALSLLYGPTLTSVHDYWENHRFD